MKKTVHSALGILLSLLFVVCLVSCGNTVNATGVWEKATYLKNAEFGKGATTVQVEVSAEEQSVTFTLHTDKTTLGDALLEHKLIAGEESAYGLYVKVVNGMTADYDVDQSYWAFYKDGEYMMTGVDGTEISDGEHYELVYTKPKKSIAGAGIGDSKRVNRHAGTGLQKKQYCPKKQRADPPVGKKNREAAFCYHAAPGFRLFSNFPAFRSSFLPCGQECPGAFPVLS